MEAASWTSFLVLAGKMRAEDEVVTDEMRRCKEREENWKEGWESRRDSMAARKKLDEGTESFRRSQSFLQADFLLLGASFYSLSLQN